MTVHINNLVPSEFPNRSSRSVRSLISTLICILESSGIIMKLKQLSTEFEYFTQGSKLTLVRWPVASGFPVGPVESVLHWPGWPAKF